VLIRQTAPVLGAAGSPYDEPGGWQVSVAMRGLRSDDHYRLDEEQVQRHTLGTFVVNHQYAADVTFSYALSERWSVGAGVPWVVASWSIPSPTSPVPGPRAQQDARGLGDISVASRYWLFDTKKHLDGNVALGVGVKMPTGNYRARDMFPDSTGQNNAPRYVDQSVQPGDGGWGLELEAQTFRRFSRWQFFASASYLANPRDTNGTPSLLVSRLPPGAQPSANAGTRVVNSVPDQYLTRVGGAMPIGKSLVASLSYRIEGQRRYDLLGASHGFRRPGLEMFAEPGVSVGVGRQVMSLTVPIAFYRNRKPDPYTGLAGDATFPNFIVLGSYSLRFGGKKTAPGQPFTPVPKDKQ
jgi:hypothetical protein